MDSQDMVRIHDDSGRGQHPAHARTGLRELERGRPKRGEMRRASGSADQVIMLEGDEEQRVSV